MANETFVPQVTIFPDYGIGANWSGGEVPGLGTVAVVIGVAAVLDPQVTVSADVVLRDGAALSGNDGGYVLGSGSTVFVQGADALYGDGAIVNRGVISLAGETAALRVVVENGGGGILLADGLLVPSFENAGQVVVNAGATLAVEGTEFSNIGAVVVDGGTLLVQGGGVDGGQGDPTPDGATPDGATPDGAAPGGAIVIADGGYVAFGDAVTDQTVRFSGTGTLALADVADAARIEILGFTLGSKIMIPSVAAGATLLRNVTFVGVPEHEAPMVVATGAGAEILLEPVMPCLARGTGILTPLGYVPVETLRPGQMVVTARGAVRPVRWVGARTLDIAAHTRPEAVRPVRVLAGALAPDVPVRPVRLSPDHALLLRGVLVPVKLLVNEATVLREADCQAVTYWHVELDRHDMLLAENLPVESYLDTGNRAMFERCSGVVRANPVFGRGRQWDARAYAPLCLGGPVLRDIRAALRAQAYVTGYRTRTLTDVALWVGGHRYGPVRGRVERPVFALPVPHDGLVAVRSPRFVPAAFSDGEAEDDFRVLGVAISRVRLGRRVVAAREVAVSGLHARGARDTADWTDGNAVIAVPAEVGRVALEIAALPLGWVRQS